MCVVINSTLLQIIIITASYIIQNQINNYVSHCSSIIFCDVNPEMYQSVSRIDNQRKIIMKEYLEENFGIDMQMKVLDFEF